MKTFKPKMKFRVIIRHSFPSSPSIPPGLSGPHHLTYHTMRVPNHGHDFVHRRSRVELDFCTPLGHHYGLRTETTLAHNRIGNNLLTRLRKLLFSILRRFHESTHSLIYRRSRVHPPSLEKPGFNLCQAARLCVHEPKIVHAMACF